MPTYLPPAVEHRFTEDALNRRMPVERDVMLGLDSLRPDPITMAIRRGFAAIGRLLRRDQQPVPGVTVVQPAGRKLVRLPVREIRDRAA